VAGSVASSWLAIALSSAACLRSAAIESEIVLSFALSRVVGVEGVGTAFGAAVEGVGTAFGAAVEGAMTGVAGALPAHWLFSQAQPVKVYEEPSVHLHSMYRGEPQHWLTATLYPHLTWHCDLHADADPSSHGD